MPPVYADAQVPNTPRQACVYQLLQNQAERTPDALAILAPERAPLTYGQLLRHIEDVVQTLHTLGVGRQDRLALVLPNGPEMAVAFLALASGATCAPLNLGYSIDEFDLYLANLHAEALLIPQGMDSPARAVAQARGIRVIELLCMPKAEAGLFTLIGATVARPVVHGFAGPNDVALVLHTSGTTSQPKVVPLTHANICTAADNLLTALTLDARDRGLNLVPLFHTYGLVAATLTSLAAGASVVCTPGFYAPQFFAWLEQFRPTWYQAVPAMHQAILACAAQHRETIARCRLRFIRSGTAPLPPSLRAELERVFNSRVVEGYGTVEASGLVTCNPPPSRPWKSGSVGRTIGPEVAIMDDAGTRLPAGETGEIAVRGATVMQGYDMDPTANRGTFIHGWFRTGDEGFLDADGYLFLTGRIKEIINRGGEKVSPREVEEVLLEHPAVAQVAVFAIPHAQLGEEVAAAIVLGKNTSATAGEIREFASARLADFKVPRRVVFVDEIPKGPTGKVQRMGLAAKLGLAEHGQSQSTRPAGHTAPRTLLEEKLAAIWAQVLGLEHVGVSDDFFELGGHSLQAVHLFAQIGQVFGRDLPLSTLFQASTIEQLASIVSQEGRSITWSSLVAIQPAGSNPPFFCVHEHGGEVLRLRDLAHHLGADQPFYGLQAQGLDGRQVPYTHIEDMAAHYIQEMLTVQSKGSYFLGGYCFGGMVAFEMARQLHAQGQKVALLTMFNAYAPGYPKVLPWVDRRIKQRIQYHMGNLRGLRSKEKLHYFSEKGKIIKARIERRIKNCYKLRPGIEAPMLRALRKVQEANTLASRCYVPKVYPGRIILFRSSKLPEQYYDDLQMGWGGLAARGVEIHYVPGESGAIVYEPRVRSVAAQLRECLREAQATDLERGTRDANDRA
jgi:acyl-CoA synthetase (AMP-forming)/AMP-acid ligase II/thioesterase domain-containing protein